MDLVDINSSESGEGENGQRSNKREIALEGSDASDDDAFRVNETFAKSFEKRKRAQELQAAKHLNLGSDDDEGGSGSSSESETEDEDAEMLTTALDLKIMKTINKIRSKDPDIYDTGKAWFSDDDDVPEGDAEDDRQGHQKEKPMKYKDVVREQILQARSAEEVISSDEEEEDGDVGEWGSGNRRRGRGREGQEAGRKILAYDEEQEQLRRGFLGSVAEQERGSDSGGGDDEEGEGDGLLKVRQKTAAEVAEEEELLQKEAEKMAEQGDGGEEDAFLKDFVANRRWIDPHAKGTTQSYDEILNASHVEDSEDEEDIDRADEFESKYNFRFEEEGGREIAMHARNVQGSMRRKDDRRKRERESRKARKADERQRKEAELRRLKNIKREEIRKRLQAIQEMSGGALVNEELGGADAGAGGGKGVGAHAQAILDGDFDSQRWDAVTQKAFGDGYYEAEDVDQGWEPGDDPLEGLGDLDQYSDHPEAGAGGIGDFGAVKEQEDDDKGVEENVREEEEEDYGELEGDEEADGGGEGEKFGAIGAQKEKLLDELYKLDYEDIIGDVPCRFKYTKVNSSNFGLSPGEILLADDKELNKYVPLKKLAPYRADEPKLDARRRRRLREEVKEREKAAEAELLALRAKKKRRGKRKAAAAAVDASNETVGTPADVTGELAGGKRRRRKKGQKKQRDRKEDGGGGADGGEGLGEDVADMVPRVRPMMSPSSVGGEGDSGGVEQERDGWEGEDDEVAAVADVSGDGGDAKGKRKKRRKKRGRSSDGGLEKAQDGEATAGEGEVAHSERDSARDCGDSVSAARAGSNVFKKIATGETQVGGSGGQDNGARERSTGKERVSNRGVKKVKKKTDAKTAKLANATGVSKSRLASYGL